MRPNNVSADGGANKFLYFSQEYLYQKCFGACIVMIRFQLFTQRLFYERSAVKISKHEAVMVNWRVLEK